MNQILSFIFSNYFSKCIHFTLKKGSFTNFKPSWHNMNYELGTLDSYENMNGTKPAPTNKKNNITNKNLTYQQTANAKNGMSSTDSITHDILPSNEDEVKRWSCDMDSNILF